MNVAIVSDGIFCRCGAERVLLDIHRAFPSAPIYTPVYFRDNTFEEFKGCDIRTSWYNVLVKNELQYKKWLFPLGILAIRSFNFNKYDVVILSTTHCAKYIKLGRRQFVIAYCHTPFRLLWSKNSYHISNANPLVSFLLKCLRKMDRSFAQRPNVYFTNSVNARNRIRTCYRGDDNIYIIPPSVHIKPGALNTANQDYYLVVSRLEYYKKIDLAMQACKELHRKLIIIGSGTRENRLHIGNDANITHYKNVPDTELWRYYSGCKAVIFPQLEDYGIVPLEANANGKPVIAFGEGGILETMIPYANDAMKATALFFKEQTVDCLKKAILQFEGLQFDPQFIHEHAMKFNQDAFVRNFQSLVFKAYGTHISSGGKKIPAQGKPVGYNH